MTGRAEALVIGLALTVAAGGCAGTAPAQEGMARALPIHPRWESCAAAAQPEDAPLLPQASDDPFPGSVLESALVGRHPHIDFWQWESDADRAIARDCLAAMDLARLDDRDVTTLSGGERRRLVAPPPKPASG